MKSIARALALSAIATLVTACGGGGGSSSGVAPAVTATAAARGAAATANVTFRFPRVAHATFPTSATKWSKGRKPAYINPNGGALVVTANGQTLNSPAGAPYFTLPGSNPDGSSTLAITLFSGSFAPGTVTFAEYDDAALDNLLAFGSNQSYTDSSGNFNDGSFTLTPGGTISPVVTMAMNVTQIAITSDPVMGSDAMVITPDFNNPYVVSNCANAGSGNPYYVFPTDPTGAFALPNNPSGYLGGDTSNPIPGTPLVALTQQFPTSNDHLAVSLASANIFIYQNNNGDGVKGQVTTNNPASSVNGVYSAAQGSTGVPSSVTGYFSLAQNGC